MKKIFILLSTLLLTIGICVAQSTNPKDYNPEDIYYFFGDADSFYHNISVYKDKLVYLNYPIELIDNLENFSTLKEYIIYSNFNYQENLISVPISFEFEKKKSFFDGYFPITYNISNQNSEIKIIIEEKKDKIDNWPFEISKNVSSKYIPKFLLDYVEDNNPIGTKLFCETTIYLNMNIKNSKSFTFKDSYIDSKGKEKTKKRTILINQVELNLKLADSGKITKSEEPQKNYVETPFGKMEFFDKNISLKNKLPNYIKIGTITYPSLIGLGYDADEVFKIQKENELIELYKTRTGYKLKNNVCGLISAYYLSEKNSEIYLGSTHLLCTDEVWEKLHADIIRKEGDYVIDLRLIDNKVQFVIAPVKKIYTQGDL